MACSCPTGRPPAAIAIRPFWTTETTIDEGPDILVSCHFYRRDICYSRVVSIWQRGNLGVMRHSDIKRHLSLFCSLPGFFGTCQWLRGVSGGHEYLRIVNYHETPECHIANLEKHLKFYRKHFENVTLRDLESLLNGGDWKLERPGLIISFDDGLRSNFEHARPLLEKYGFGGWFMIPTAFVDGIPTGEDLPGYAGSIAQDESWPDSRFMVSTEELRSLGESHELASHTVHHTRMAPELDSKVIRAEVRESKKQLEDISGRNIDMFCWVGGEPENYHPQAMREIRDVGYRYAFMTCSGTVNRETHPLQLHRTNIEAAEPLSLVKLQLSGFMDCFHTIRRRRINRLTLEALGN